MAMETKIDINRLLELKLQNKTTREIGKILGYSHVTIAKHLKKIEKRE